MSFSDIPAWVQTISVVIPAIIGAVAWFIKSDAKSARMDERIHTVEAKIDRLGDLGTRIALLEQKIDMQFGRLSDEIRNIKGK